MNFLSFLLYIIPLRVNSVITIITTMVAIKRKKGTHRITTQLGQSRCAKKFDGFGILYSICERKSVSQPQTSFIRVKSIQTSGIVSRVSPPSSLPHPLDEKLSHRDPVCYRSSTPLLEFLDNPVYRSGRSARHSKTISRVDLRLPYVCVRDES